MLQVLYQGAEVPLQPAEEEHVHNMFTSVEQFLNDQKELLELKKLFHFSDLALNHSSSLDVKQLPMIDVAFDMLKSQSQHKRLQWEEKSQVYITLLETINGHVSSLLQKLHALEKKPALLFSLSDQLFQEQALKRENNERAQGNSVSHDVWVELKHKINLWQQCYSNISRLVL